VIKLKTFSRLDAGKFGTYDIEDSIDSTLTILNHRLRGRITVEKSFAARRDLDCYGGELNQVFMNIIDNAIDALDESGTITIRTFEQDGFYAIAIRDDGSGMDQDTSEHIFEPFFTTKAVGEGTGMGLSLSYGIVQAHRGTIDVQSAPGTGTEFIVRIPLDFAP
jgi:two-component system NtrC family sensor kinase